MSKLIAKQNLPEFDFTQDIGSGMEGADKEAFAIPFLKILQKISPQVDEADSAYVAGAKGGMLLNTVTQSLHDNLLFLPCAYQRRFLRWAARGSDRGFKGELLPEDVAVMLDKGEIVDFEGRLYFPLEDGTVNPKKCDSVQDTRSHFGLILDEETGATQPALLALSSTQVKKSKLLMGILSAAKVASPNGLVTPPTWMNKIRLSTAIESNDQGSWYGLKLAAEGFVTSKDAYEAGKAFHALVTSGSAKANYEATAPDAPSDDKF